MLVKDILDNNRFSFSFEFFPPKDEPGWENLFANISDLMPLKPAYVSVTYGAGGSTRDRTHKLIVRIQQETNLTVVSHLTCVGSNRAETGEILRNYAASGVENILALRPLDILTTPALKMWRWIKSRQTFYAKFLNYMRKAIHG